MKRLLLDCDPAGVDDILAIMVALLHREASLEMITTTGGNIPVEATHALVYSIVELCGGGERVQIRQGLNPPSPWPSMRTPRQQGGATYDLSDNPAIAALQEKVKQYPHELTLVTTAPLTNISALFEAFPKTAKLLERVVVMGGAIQVPGNITAVAEFNIFINPIAAQTVLNSGANVILVPLDVTLQPRFCLPHLQRLSRSSKLVARYVEKLIKPYLDYHRIVGHDEGCPMHDPLAVAIAISPDLATIEPMAVSVEGQGEVTRGQIVVDRRPIVTQATWQPKTKVCTRVDRERFLELFLGLVGGMPTHEEDTIGSA